MSTSRTLSSGVTRAITPISSISRVSSSSLIVAELGAGDRAALDPELAGDRLRRDGVVAGDHPHLDPGRLRERDRRLRRRARRVDDADEREHRQPVEQRQQVGRSGRTSPGRSPCARSRARAGPACRAARSRPGSARGSSSSTGDRRQVAGVERRDAARASSWSGAPLTKHAHDVLAGLVLHPVEGRHQLVGGVERQLGDARVALARRRRRRRRPSRRARRARPRSGRRSSRRRVHDRVGGRAPSAAGTARAAPRAAPPTCLIAPSVE